MNLTENKLKTIKIKRPHRGIDCSNISKVMQDKGVIVQELADGIKVNQSHISRIINNKRPNISLRIAWDIADYLKVGINDLFIKN